MTKVITKTAKLRTSLFGLKICSRLEITLSMIMKSGHFVSAKHSYRWRVNFPLISANN